MARATLFNGFLPWAAARGVTETNQLDQRVLEALSRYLLEEHRTPKGEPLSRENVRTYMRTMREFLRWAQKRGELAGLSAPIISSTFIALSPDSRSIDAFVTVSNTSIVIPTKAIQKELGLARKYVPAVMIDYIAVSDHARQLRHRGLGSSYSRRLRVMRSR